MKKKLLILALVLSSTIAIQAQNPVLNLSNYLRNGMLERAYENLNIAMQDERYTSEPRTWLLRGNLYYNTFRCFNFVNEIEIGMESGDVRQIIGDPRTDFKRQRTPDGRANKWEWDLGFEVLFIDNKVYSYTDPVNGFYKTIAPTAEDALRLAAESYMKAAEMDPTLRVDLTFPVNPMQGLSILSDGYVNIAAASYNTGDFESSFKNFLIAHQIKAGLGMNQPHDTIAGHYAVLSAGFYARMLAEEKKYEEALEIIQTAKKIKPDDTELALSEADTYLKMKEFLKTKEILENILSKQPDNAQLYFVIGNIYDQLGRDTSNTKEQNEEYFDLTVRFYEEAINIYPDYFDALFNLGTVYNNKGVDLLAFASTLRYPDPRFDDVIKEVDRYFRLALPNLIRAHNINPADPDPIRMLYSIYLRLRMNDEAAEMKELIDAFPKKPSE